jgi:hypothetical protein
VSLLLVHVHLSRTCTRRHAQQGRHVPDEAGTCAGHNRPPHPHTLTPINPHTLPSADPILHAHTCPTPLTRVRQPIRCRHVSEPPEPARSLPLTCALAGAQAELEEAQAALSRKHLQQQVIVDRAEAAEAERDRLAEELVSLLLVVVGGILLLLC